MTWLACRNGPFTARSRNRSLLQDHLLWYRFAALLEPEAVKKRREKEGCSNRRLCESIFPRLSYSVSFWHQGSKLRQPPALRVPVNRDTNRGCSCVFTRFRMDALDLVLASNNLLQMLREFCESCLGDGAAAALVFKMCLMPLTLPQFNWEGAQPVISFTTVFRGSIWERRRTRC